MNSFLRAAGVLALLTLVSPARAEAPALNSHEVNADHSVTFRYLGPAAKQVGVLLDFAMTPVPLQKNADGVWSLTTAPLAQEMHFYTFVVDGTPIYDPQNGDIKPNLVFKNNLVCVPGVVPLPWDLTAVPHGVIHRHTYASTIIQGLGDQPEEYYVYTPPGYNPAGAVRYPVLYLLHGWSGGADDWTAAGQVHLMLDNLIAQGRVVPMIAVMPQSYGAMSFVRNGFKVWEDPVQVAENVRLFDAALFQEIVPQVQRAYRINDDHAIAGLSMGGGQSLLVGLNHPEYFGWVGSYSAALPYAGFDGLFPRMPQAGPARLLWIACGAQEGEGVADNRRLVTWFNSKGLSPVAVETPGIHNWHTWRDNFIHFTPLLFRPAAAAGK